MSREILKEEPKNIIVRMPNWLGDLVMATPVLSELRRRFPHASITAMVSKVLEPVIAEDPNIDELFAFTNPNGWLRRPENRDVILQLRRGNYDLGILLTNSFTSAWWFWRGHVGNRIGYTGHWRRCLLNHAIAFPQHRAEQHLVYTYKQLLEPLGISRSSSSPALYLTEVEKAAAREKLNQMGVQNDEVVIGINPGAAYGSAKCWLPERFSELTGQLLEDPKIRLVYFGDRAGTPLVNQICKGAPERVINLAGKTTLRELIACIDACDIILTNDSGPMHVAAALKKPLVALFGSTNDTATGPFGIGKVIHKRVECSPCYKRVCPIDFRCMKRIESSEVYEELRAMIIHHREIKKGPR